MKVLLSVFAYDILIKQQYEFKQEGGFYVWNKSQRCGSFGVFNTEII